MSGDDGDADGPGGFAPPPFDAAAALAQLQRACRDLRLTARGDAFERRGRRLVELALDDGAVAARLAKRPALTPEWERRLLRSAADQRQWLDTLKKKLAEWDRDE